MAMIVGDAAAGTGMAGVVYAGIKTQLQAATIAGVHPIATPIDANQAIVWEAISNGIAQGVVNYIHSNAVVVGTAVT